MISSEWPEQGQYIDVTDQQGRWLQGFVIERKPDSITVKYVTQFSKNSHTISLPISDSQQPAGQYKIARFRTHTRCNKGKISQDIKQKHKNLHEIEVRTKTMLEFAGCLRSKTGKELVQYLRGEHFLYLNCLLQQRFTQQEALVKVNQYFSKHLELTTNYINLLLELGLEQCFSQRQSMTSEDEEVWRNSYVSCAQEITDGLQKISSHFQRVLVDNNGMIKWLDWHYLQFQAGSPYASNQLQATGCFQTIKRFIVQSGEVRTRLPDFKFPIRFILVLLQALDSIAVKLKKDKDADMSSLLQIAASIIIDFFRRLQPRDIDSKQIDEEISYILININVMMSKYPPAQHDAYDLEVVRLQYCTMKFKSSIEEVQLKGIEMLISFVKNVRMTRQKFRELIQQEHLVDLLFYDERSRQFQKNAIIWLRLAFSSELMVFQIMMAVWKRKLEGQPIASNYLKEQWQEVAENITAEHCVDFIEMIRPCFFENDDIDQEMHLYELRLLESLIKSLADSRGKLKKKEGSNKQLEKFIDSRVQKNLRILLQKQKEKQFYEIFAKIIYCWQTTRYINIIFKQLPIPQKSKTSLLLLNTFYDEYSYSLKYVPTSFADDFLIAMKTCSFTTKEVKKILAMVNHIMKSYKECHLKKDQSSMKEIFSKYWQYFQSLCRDYRQLLYNLMLENNEFQEEEMQEQDYSPINEIFSDELRKFINSDILVPQKFADFDRLTRKEVNIIVEFFISANIIEKRIDTKRYYEGWRSLLVRNSELIKQEILWVIFRKCKSAQIAYQQLVPYLIRFYFYFSPDFPRNLRKGRMEMFFNEVKTCLQESHSSNNIQLCKMSLHFLKEVIQIVKDDKLENESKGFFDYQAALTILFNGKRITPQVNSAETLANIKIRLAKRYKLNPIKLIIFDSSGQEIGFDVKELPFGRMKEAEFKIVEAAKDEETTTQFFFSCMGTSLQEILLRLMEKENLVADVEKILQHINMGLQCYPILSSFFVNCSEESIKSKDNRFVSMALELLNKYIDNQQFMKKCIASPSFSSLLKILSFPLVLGQPNTSRDGSLMSMLNACSQINEMTLLSTFTEFLVRVFRKGYKIQNKQKAAEQCLDLLLTSILFESQSKSDRIVRERLLKLGTNWITILEETITIDKMFVFLFQSPKIQQFMTILFSLEYSQLKIIIVQRLKKYLNQERVHPSHSSLAETSAALIFIEGFYNRFAVSFEKLEKLEKGESKKLPREINEVSTIICKITSVVSIGILDALSCGLETSFYQRIIESVNKFIDASDQKQTDGSISMLCLNLQLLKTLLNKKPEMKTAKIVDFVMDKCFGMFKNTTDFGAGKKHYIMRYLFDIIVEVLHSPWNSNLHGKVMKIFIYVHNIPFWRENNKWSVPNTSNSKHHYMGLINPGCICYMNSLLQQLFMIEDFRNEITKLNTYPTSDPSKEKQGNGVETPILQALKELFLKMEHSDEKITSPVDFARTIKNSENKLMIRINEQMDIDEFEIILFDKIEKELQLLGSKNLIRELFGGVYSNQIISTECEHRSQREETFISVSLQVKKSIFQSLKSFVKVDLLDGDNKYFCESCNKKVTAEKIQCLKKLPPFLFLCLKRFEFNFELEAKIKINEYCEFPQKLSLKEFSTEIVTPNSNKAQGNEECFDYKLRGVVVHTGSADCGHYYSYIQTKEGEWFEFNDEDVYSFDIDKLPQEAFGGKNSADDQKIRNAYMLIYERQDRRKTAAMIAQQNQEKVENKAEVQRILKQNADIQKYDLLFSQVYDEFIQKIVKSLAELITNQDLNAFHSEFYEFFLSYYFLILLRKQGFQKFYQFSILLENFLEHSKQMRLKFLFLFTSCSFIEEAFVYNPSRERCKVISYLLSAALTCYTDETFDVDIETNMPFIFVLTAISTSLTNHGSIPELTLALKKFLKHLLTFHPDHLSFITHKYAFQVIYIDLLFSNSDQPSQLQYKAQLLALNKQTVKIPYYNAVEINDKKYFNNDSYYTWAVLALTLQQLKTIAIQSQDNRALEMLGHLASSLAEATPAKAASIIYQCHNQRGVSDMYKVYKLFNLEKKLLEGIDQGLKKFQSGKYRPFMLLILSFLRDPKAECLYDDLLSILENGYRHNQRYIMETDLLNQWIIKLVTHNDLIMNKFKERKTFVEEIIRRIKKNPTPALETLKKQRLVNSQKILNRHYDILVSTSQRDYEENSLMICHWYEQVQQGKFIARGRPQPTEEEFTEGMQVEYYDSAMQKWITTEVMSNNLGRVVLRAGMMMTNLTCWEDSEKLRKKQVGKVEQEMQRQENSDFSYREQQEEEDYI